MRVPPRSGNNMVIWGRWSRTRCHICPCARCLVLVFSATKAVIFGKKTEDFCAGDRSFYKMRIFWADSENSTRYLRRSHGTALTWAKRRQRLRSGLELVKALHATGALIHLADVIGRCANRREHAQNSADHRRALHGLPLTLVRFTVQPAQRARVPAWRISADNPHACRRVCTYATPDPRRSLPRRGG